MAAAGDTTPICGRPRISVTAAVVTTTTAAAIITTMTARAAGRTPAAVPVARVVPVARAVAAVAAVAAAAGAAAAVPDQVGGHDVRRLWLHPVADVSQRNWFCSTSEHRVTVT